MNGSSVICATLASGELIIANKDLEKLMIYRDGAEHPTVKLTSLFDILALRDLLNDAYPPGVLKIDKMRMQKKDCGM